MTKQQKMIAAGVGGLVLLYLLYRWYSNNQSGSTSTGSVAPDTSSGDFASLAGQEQADMAAVQGQNSQLAAQEQSDVAGLTSSIGGLTGQESSDISGLTSAIAGWGDQINQILSGEQQLAGAQSTMGGQISSLATGVTAINRAQNESIQTHRGGPFYNYYVKVTGKKPPADVLTSNFLYQAWKSGVKATALQGSQTHPSSKNNQIAHPNSNHAQKQAVKPAAPKAAPKPAAKPAPKPPAPKPKPKPPAPKPAPKSVKTKPSGVRR